MAIFIGNELFKHYYERLAFTAVLLFFGLFSYAIVTVPIYLHQIGVFAFLLSGLAAIAAFTIFLWVLFLFGRKAFVEAKWPIVGGAALVYALINLFWFTNVLPPLPVALAKSGIYTDVKHVGDKAASARASNSPGIARCMRPRSCMWRRASRSTPTRRCSRR